LLPLGVRLLLNQMATFCRYKPFDSLRSRQTEWLSSPGSTPVRLRNGTASAIFAIAGVFLSACSTSSDVVTGPSPIKCALTAQAPGSTFPPTGGSGTLTIATTRECAWSAQSEADWVSLTSPAGGQGNGEVQFSIAAHTEPAARTAAIVVNDQRVPISQEGRPCEFGLSSTHASVDAAGGEQTITITASSAQCRWTAASNVPWITVLAGEGTGNGSVTLRVEPAAGPPRTGTVTIAGQAVDVEQGSGCTYAVNATSVTVAPSGDAGQVRVTAPPGCTWTALSDADWITITAGASGSGPGEVRFTVTASDGPGRAGTIRVAGRIVTVTQGSGCTLGIAPSSQTVAATGGSGAIRLDTAGGCGWSAAASASWITLAGATGSGPGSLQFVVAANSGPARTGTITVAGQTFTVNQTSACDYVFAPPAHDFDDANAGAGAILIIVSGQCTWEAASNAAWITITAGASGLGNGTTQFRVTQNTGPPRSGTLTIAGRSYTVTQVGR
jgi:trimeric autotransporter adhesin